MRIGRKRGAARRGAALGMALALATATGTIAATPLDFGSVNVGASAIRSQVVPLSAALSELDPAAVLYAGGDPIVDSFLPFYGLAAPVTAGSLYAAMGEVTATYHVDLAIVGSGDLLVDDSTCLTGTVSCTAEITFQPSATGPIAATVTASILDLDVDSSDALLAAMASFLGNVVEAELGFTVTGVGSEPGSGGLNLEVAVAPEPVPCLVIDASVIDFGTLPFSTEAAISAASRGVSATSCSTGAEAIYAAGTDAAGDGDPAAAWALSSVGGSPCAIGIEAYGVVLTADLGAGPQPPLQLSTANAPWLSLEAEASAATTVDYQMPCVGSSGAGQTMTSQITFLATAP
ncbi:MAG: hypothetical protein L0227_07830 [Chloroflexi bacterium]|nr:hypothetical protein [Chloroflexota bacterium]